MKICPNCAEDVEDNFDMCWNCNFSFPENLLAQIQEYIPGTREIECLRCVLPMKYSGNYKFHEGFFTGVFGNKESFDLYVCQECGKVEFFIPQDEQKFKLF